MAVFAWNIEWVFVKKCEEVFCPKQFAGELVCDEFDGVVERFGNEKPAHWLCLEYRNIVRSRWPMSGMTGLTGEAMEEGVRLSVGEALADLDAFANA